MWIGDKVVIKQFPPPIGEVIGTHFDEESQTWYAKVRWPSGFESVVEQIALEYP